MQATALKDEAISLLDSLSASKMRTVIQFARFIAQQPEDEADSADEAAKAERDRRDIEIINANAAYLNAGAEESLGRTPEIQKCMRKASGTLPKPENAPGKPWERPQPLKMP